MDLRPKNGRLAPNEAKNVIPSLSPTPEPPKQKVQNLLYVRFILQPLKQKAQLHNLTNRRFEFLRYECRELTRLEHFATQKR